MPSVVNWRGSGRLLLVVGRVAAKYKVPSFERDLSMSGAIQPVEGKLPWPADAVMIVAAKAGTERRERMESVVPAECRDCGDT